MLEAVPHRGPSTAYAALGRASVGAIHHQDAPDAAVGISDGLVVALAGAIDNAADLTTELDLPAVSDHGPESEAQRVVALIAGLYRKHGTRFPARLRGMFSGFVSDGESAFCFRDQLGHKPIFYRHDGKRFWAASEPKQVVAGAGLAREPDLDVIDRIYYRSLDDESPSALRGVERLPKMTGLEVSPERAVRTRYWFPERLLETGSYAPAELQERFDALMTNAMRRSFTGKDVLFLSGGIDSPALAAYGADLHVQVYGQPLAAISIVYPRYPSVDESRYVTMLAAHHGMPLHTYEQEGNAMADLPYWTALADTPYRAAALAQYSVEYLRAKSLGFDNLLTGEHAEFLMAIQWFTLDHYLSHGRYRAAWRELRQHRAKHRSWLEITRRAGRAMASDRLIRAADRLRGKRSRLVPDWVDAGVATEDEPIRVRDRWRHSQLGAFIGPGTSLEADEVCQAACGVTVRRPWTDVDLWELFLSLPAEQKFPDLGSKSLVRRLLRGRVPDEILDRTDKTVFDEAGRAGIDYDVLESLLTAPDHRIRGVDYGALAQLIRDRALTMLDYQWARDLANIHAFLLQWAPDRQEPIAASTSQGAPA
jgi:asparagine synthase (glutamine-hydrolysing)